MEATNIKAEHKTQKTQKQAIVCVSCATEDFDEAPCFLHLEMTDELSARIKELSKLVKEAQTFRIEEICYAPEWSDQGADINFPGEEASVIQAVKENPSRVDGAMISVTEFFFRFTAYPKFCGDDSRLVSRSIPIAWLDSANEDTYTDLE